VPASANELDGDAFELPRPSRGRVLDVAFDIGASPSAAAVARDAAIRTGD
jgi:hypothetical protein